VTFPVKIVGKEDIGSFFFPKHPGMISTLLHQLMHPGGITRVLLAVGPPGFTKGDKRRQGFQNQHPVSYTPSILKNLTFMTRFESNIGNLNHQ
jgi:hypothetical protein